MKKKIQLPHTGNKLIDIIVVAIILLSCLGVIAYAYNFVVNLLIFKLPAMFMCVVFGMLFFSIIQYAVKYFIFNQRVTIVAMLSSFSTSVLMSTITVNGLQNNLFVTAMLIVILVPFMSNDLTHTRRCITVICIVFVLCIVWTLLKTEMFASLTKVSNPLENLYLWYDALRALLIWIIISALFLMRFYLLRKKYKAEIDKIGHDAFMDQYRKQLEDAAIEKAIADIKKQSEKNAKARNIGKKTKN